MTSPDNPKSSGDPERTSVLNPKPTSDTAGEHTPSAGPAAGEDPAAESDATERSTVTTATDGGGSPTDDSPVGSDEQTKRVSTSASSRAASSGSPAGGGTSDSAADTSAADTSAAAQGAAERSGTSTSAKSGSANTGSANTGGANTKSGNVSGSDAPTARVSMTGPKADQQTEAAAAPPPWQRVPVDLASNGAGEHHGDQDGGAGLGLQSGLGEPPAHTPAPQSGGAPASGYGGPPAANRPLGSFAGTQPRPGGSGPATARRPGRGPRRASLQVKRVDPWSVLKLAAVLSVALFFVWLVAVGVLYGVLSGMGVFDKLNGTYNELTQAGSASGDQLISAQGVFGVATVIGLVNIVLFTALATLAAFIYNASSDLVGGIEVTLSERE